MKNKNGNEKTGIFRNLAKLTSSSAAVAPPDLKCVLSSAALTSEAIGQTQDFLNQLDELIEEQ